ncbi:hypothetical protein OAJ27_01865 [bacterium]|nr:hypothetical protein [bacterium]
MKKIKIYILLALLSIGMPLQALDLNTKDISLSGHYLGLWNGFDTKKETQSHFDYATNFDVEFTFSETLTGMFQLQMSPGNGRLGFPGPQPSVTDLNLSYQPTSKHYQLTMGSFDTPFGPFENLSNNANTLENEHIINDIFYSSLAGPVGTLNTLGLKADTSINNLDITLALNNGTGESSINNGNSYGTTLQIRNKTWIPRTEMGISGIKSNDKADAGEENNNSFETDYSGALIHFKTKLYSHTSFNGYAGSVRYNNTLPNQDDTITVLRFGTTYQLDTTKKFSLQWSSWQPQHHSGSGKTSAVPNPGLSEVFSSNTNVTDSMIHRTQATLSLKLDTHIWMKTGYINDNYEHGPNTHALITSINGAF